MHCFRLFLEKIRTHPDYKCVSTKEKALNSQKLREVLPIAENLKTRLLEQYTLEYERFQKDAVFNSLFLNNTYWLFAYRNFLSLKLPAIGILSYLIVTRFNNL